MDIKEKIKQANQKLETMLSSSVLELNVREMVEETYYTDAPY